MSSKASSSSSSSSSYEEVSNEEFNWTDEETNKEYINFPLKKWNDIVYEYIYIYPKTLLLIMEIYIKI